VTPRTLRHAFSRTPVLACLAGGLGLGLLGYPIVTASLLSGVGVMGGAWWANRKDLSQQLYWLDETKKHGITRTLKLGEKRALTKINEYSERLCIEVFEPLLADETRDKAWTLVRDASGQDSSAELNEFIEQLAPIKLGAESDTQESLEQRVQQSVERRLKVERELDRL
jgi:hypothetical protein